MTQPVDASQIAQFLEGVAMFAGLDQENRGKIARVMGYAEYAAGQDIVLQGSPGDALYFVARGLVHVLVVDAEVGVEQRVAMLGMNEIFGEMALLLDEPRTATVRAAQDCACIILGREAFLRLYQHVPQVALAVVRNLARRLQEQSRTLAFRFVKLSEQKFHAETYASIPAPILERHQIVPLAAEGDTLIAAVTRPNDPIVLETLRSAVPGMKLRLLECGEDDYRQFLATVVRTALGGAVTATRSFAVPVAAHRAGDVMFVEPDAKLRRQTGEIPGDQIVRLVNEIVCEAANRGASDIHIEPGDQYSRVRLRVDGRMIGFRDDVPVRFHAPLTSRIKILSEMDISERRCPQDGRIGVRIGERNLDLRVNVLPTLHGEKIVMRVLDPAKSVVPLEKLIVSESLASIVRKAVFRPTGGILICGPTGSGKTTTLYSALYERKQAANDLNIVTLEDPIEYTLEGVNQVQVREESDMGFAQGLRAILRQDPDIIMVGEMRDAETAQTALEAALTGHLVLSTLHTEGTIAAVTRLVEMGCAPYLVASAVDLVVAQRLLRRVCSSCAAPHRYSDVVRHNLERAGLVAMSESESLVKGAGCDACFRTGYRGRVGAYEVLRLNDQLREAIGLAASETTLKSMAPETGAITSFKHYAGYLLRSGLTSPSEVLRYFSGD